MLIHVIYVIVAIIYKVGYALNVIKLCKGVLPVQPTPPAWLVLAHII